MQIELTEKEQDYLIRVLEQNYADIDADYGDEKYCGFSNPIKHQIYLKLFGKFYPIYFAKIIELAQKNSRINVRLTGQNSGYLNMGGGFRSIVRLNDLHKRLSYSGNVLSGLQQNGGQGTKFNEESYKQDQEKLKDILKDLLNAIGILPEELIETKYEFDI